jgi:hypothetical protein
VYAMNLLVGNYNVAEHNTYQGASTWMTQLHFQVAWGSLPAPTQTRCEETQVCCYSAGTGAEKNFRKTWMREKIISFWGSYFCIGACSG